MTSSWIASGRGRAPAEDVADRRLGLGLDVEVVRQVALRVEVDRRARAARRRGTPRSGAAPRSSCRCRPSGRAPRSSGPSRAAVYVDGRGPLRTPPACSSGRAGPAGSGLGLERRRGRVDAAPPPSAAPRRPRRSAGGSARRRSRRRRCSARHSTRSPLTNTPLRLRSSSTRTPSAWRTISAWRRETVGSSKRTSAARLRPIRVHSRASATTSDAVARRGRRGTGPAARARSLGRLEQAAHVVLVRGVGAGRTGDHVARGEQRGAAEALATAARARRASCPRARASGRSRTDRSGTTPSRQVFLRSAIPWSRSPSSVRPAKRLLQDDRSGQAYSACQCELGRNLAEFARISGPRKDELRTRRIPERCSAPPRPCPSPTSSARCCARA